MQQNLHVYDDHAGIIYLADGREVKFAPFDPKLYSSSYQAHSEAVKWAKETGVIGQDDDVVMFVRSSIEGVASRRGYSLRSLKVFLLMVKPSVSRFCPP
ncbi:TPA: hypothetical protein ACMDNU_003395 [Vibrio cholerae]